MRPDAERVDLMGCLVPDPCVDDVGREDVATEQEFVVGSSASSDASRMRGVVGTLSSSSG